ncbi:MAG: hypothetical protein KME12_15125 [Trichocoleus desertorum ATA4-8-CV12]|nr:hypothetical protein [Trichocoleus desertorum ATA4-8-CV12]
MENHDFLSDFGNEDVIAFDSTLHKTGRFRDAVQTTFTSQNMVPATLSTGLQTELRISSKDWFEDGVDCEVLRLGDKSWQKGKIKIKVSVEFYPDEPQHLESPLDDFRQTMTE